MWRFQLSSLRFEGVPLSLCPNAINLKYAISCLKDFRSSWCHSSQNCPSTIMQRATTCLSTLMIVVRIPVSSTDDGEMAYLKIYQWPNSNIGPLVLVSTALTTVPPTLPNPYYFNIRRNRRFHSDYCNMRRYRRYNGNSLTIRQNRFF